MSIHSTSTSASSELFDGEEWIIRNRFGHKRYGDFAKKKYFKTFPFRNFTLIFRRITTIFNKQQLKLEPKHKSRLCKFSFWKIMLRIKVSFCCLNGGLIFRKKPFVLLGWTLYVPCLYMYVWGGCWVIFLFLLFFDNEIHC